MSRQLILSMAMLLALIAALIVEVVVQREVIKDQRDYIEGGCRGRYQGF